MGQHTGSVDSLILARIRRIKPGTLFTPRDLADLGSRTAVASALTRHLRAGGPTTPPFDDVLTAIAAFPSRLKVL